MHAEVGGGVNTNTQEDMTSVLLLLKSLRPVSVHLDRLIIKAL